MTRDEIEALLKRQETRIRVIFETAIREYRENLDLDRIALLLARNDVLGALSEIQTIAAAVANASQAAFIAAAEAATVYIETKRRITVGWDVSNRQATQILTASRLEFIQQFSEQQRAATRLALVDGVERGLPPRELARAFRDSIGLTEYQENVVQNYRRHLQRIGAADVPKQIQREALTRALRDKRSDVRLKRLIREGRALEPQEIENMVTKYRERHIKHRAKTIARTEALSAVHEGQDNALREAVRNGALERIPTGQWITGQDGRQRDAHQELHLKEMPLDEPFVNSIGAIRYPGDRTAAPANVINCRCVRVISNL